MDEQRRRLLGATGLFLALLGVYLLTAPGRIDIIDGQWRYEVAKNWLDLGEPIVADRYLSIITGGEIPNPRTGKSYSVYNAAPSVTPMPFMAISRLLHGHNTERDHFAFSLAGPFFGALLGALLFIGYGLLGIDRRSSLLFTALFGVATLWWPASVTVFDQNQHAVLLLGAVLLAWQSGRRQNFALAASAGLLGGLLLDYQEMYALLLPVIGLAVFASPQEGSPREKVTLRRSPDRAALRRYLTFSLGCGVGLVLFCGFNYLRFGTPLILARYGSPTAANQPPMWGNPLVGLLSLAVSPGKGIFWFSPPLVLALLGARRLLARAPVLAVTVAGVSAIHLLLISHLTFFGGDWCWGPRYVVPILPLCALAFPFAAARPGHSRRLIASLATAGLLVQMLGISLDHHRFFHERDCRTYFWAEDPWVYFKQSQLLARPVEIVASIRQGLSPEATRFSSAPSGEATYCQWGPAYAAEAHLWVRHYQVFYLPRPWWGWMGRVTPEHRPLDPIGLMAGCAAALALGGALLAKSLRANRLDIGEDNRSSTLQITVDSGDSAAPQPAAVGN